MPDIGRKNVEPVAQVLVVKWRVVEFGVDDDGEPFVRFHVEMGEDPDHAGELLMHEGEHVTLQLRVVPQ